MDHVSWMCYKINVFFDSKHHRLKTCVYVQFFLKPTKTVKNFNTHTHTQVHTHTSIQNKQEKRVNNGCQPRLEDVKLTDKWCLGKSKGWHLQGCREEPTRSSWGKAQKSEHLPALKESSQRKQLDPLKPGALAFGNCICQQCRKTGHPSGESRLAGSCSWSQSKLESRGEAWYWVQQVEVKVSTLT